MTLMQHGFVVGAPQMSINLRVWNGFPDSLKKVFREVGEAHNQKFAKDLIELEGKLIDQFKAKGMHFYSFSDQDNKALEPLPGPGVAEGEDLRVAGPAHGAVEQPGRHRLDRPARVLGASNDDINAPPRALSHRPRPLSHRVPLSP